MRGTPVFDLPFVFSFAFLLAPEVLDSPWIGRGLGSTQTSSAVAAGRYKANHPHNIYLEVLMDLGLLGLAALVLLHAQYLRRLAGDEALSPVLRSFLRGARWSLWWGLAMATTTAFYMPNPAQAPWWLCLGMLFAYWGQAAAPARSPVRSPARSVSR